MGDGFGLTIQYWPCSVWWHSRKMPRVLNLRNSGDSGVQDQYYARSAVLNSDFRVQPSFVLCGKGILIWKGGQDTLASCKLSNHNRISSHFVCVNIPFSDSSPLCGLDEVG